MLIRSVPTSRRRACADHAAPIGCRRETEQTYVSGGFLEKRRVVEAERTSTLTVRRGETARVRRRVGSGKSTVAAALRG